MPINKFLDLIQPLPGYKVLEVSYEKSAISQSITNHLAGNANLVYVEYGDKALTLDKPFRALPREHDVVVLNKILLAHKYSERILKNVYTTLANASNVIIIESKEKDISKVFSLLELCDFRAANDIDIFEDKNVVVAKKMHMWGNGL